MRPCSLAGEYQGFGVEVRKDGKISGYVEAGEMKMSHG
jgi:hypothetical protein